MLFLQDACAEILTREVDCLAVDAHPLDTAGKLAQAENAALSR